MHTSRLAPIALLLLSAACSNSDEAVARFARDARRADSLVSSVDTIVVEPESLALAVGDSLPRALRSIEGRDSSGRPLFGFVPFVRVEDTSIAAIELGTLHAKRPGSTAIIVVPMRFNERVTPTRVTTRVRLVVQPRAGRASN